MKTILSLLIFALTIFFDRFGYGAERPTAAEQADLILREDGFWDIASTTGFFNHLGPPTRLPFGKLQANGVSGAMLGIGTLTDIYGVRNTDGWDFKEVPSGMTLFRNVFTGAALIQRMSWEFDATFLVAETDGRLKVALMPADIAQTRRNGGLAVVLGLDTGAEIDEDLRALRNYYRLGLRKLALVHAVGTNWADSVSSKRAGGEGGLSSFGREVVKECNRLGIMIDLSHSSDQTFWDALAVSTRPLIATHSGSRAVSPLSRNLSDAMLRALAAKGGMVGVCGLFDKAEAEKQAEAVNSEDYLGTSAYLASKYHDPYRLATALANPTEQAEAQRELGLDPTREYPFMRMDLPEKRKIIVRVLLDHLDHIIKVIGIDHVGIGSDLNLSREGYPQFVRELVTGLVERGYTRDEIRKIIYGNFIRYFQSITVDRPPTHEEGPVSTSR